MGKIINELIKGNKSYRIIREGSYMGMHGFICAGFKDDNLVTRFIAPSVSDIDMVTYRNMIDFWNENSNELQAELMDDIIKILRKNNVSDEFIDENLNAGYILLEYIDFHKYCKYTHKQVIKFMAEKFITQFNIEQSESLVDAFISQNELIYSFDSYTGICRLIDSDGIFRIYDLHYMNDTNINLFGVYASTYDDLRKLTDKFARTYHIFASNGGVTKLKNEVTSLLDSEIDSFDITDKDKEILHNMINDQYVSALLYGNDDKYGIEYKEYIKKCAKKLYDRYVAKYTKVELVKSKNGYVPKLHDVEYIRHSSRWEKPDYLYPDLSKIIFSPKYNHDADSPYYTILYTYRMDQDEKELSNFIKTNLKSIYEWTMSEILFRCKNRKLMGMIKPSQVAIKKSTHQVVVQFELKATDILYKMQEDGE